MILEFKEENLPEKHQIYEVCGCLYQMEPEEKSFLELPIKPEVVGFDKEKGRCIQENGCHCQCRIRQL